MILKIKRWVSIVVLLTFVSTLFCGLPWGYASQDKALRVTRVNQKYSITESSVALQWDSVVNAVSYTVEYPVDGGTTVSQQVYATEAMVENLLPGIVYDFGLKAHDHTDTELIGNDDDYKVKVLTEIADFKASKIDEVTFSNDSEIGTNPGLKLSWQKPKHVNSSHVLEPIASDHIDYEINIRKSKSSTADTVERFYIEYDGAQYQLKRWDGSQFAGVASDYKLVDNGDEISFEWTKEVDDASGIAKESALKPGSIYYMQIYPRFDQTSEFAETKYIETELDKDFTTTYLHVKIARHSAENAMMTVYRVRNDGTFVEVPNFLYEFWVGPDRNNLSRAYFEREEDAGSTAENYIEAFLANTATFMNYYKVTATTDETQGGRNAIELVSQPLHINLSEVDATLPPMPENLEIVDITLNDDITVSSVKIRSDKPVDYQSMTDLGDSQEYYYHLSLNTAIKDLYDDFNNPITENLYDYNGDLLGTYHIKYREAIHLEMGAANAGGQLKVIPSTQVNPGELYTGKDRVEYTLVGENLFAQDQPYPDRLLLNKIYYLKMHTVRKDGTDTLSSNQTLPISFTTPRHKANKPPLPLHLDVVEVSSNHVKLAWERVEVKEGDYFPSGIPIAHYEVAISQKRDREVIDQDDWEEEINGKYGAFLDPMFTITSETDNHLVTFFPAEKGKAREASINGDDPNDADKKLDPNTTYYITLRTKLTVEGDVYAPQYSAYSETLTATTLKTEIVDPGEEEYPLVPADFKVAEDAEGNKMVDSYSAVLTWRDNNTPDNLEYPNGNVTYEVLRTARSIENATDWDGDPATLPAIYSGLLVDAGDIENAYRSGTRDFMLETAGLTANKVYFFSIRAKKTVSVDGEQKELFSRWITIPVTTLILEPPTGFRIIQEGDYDKHEELKITWKGLERFDTNGVLQHGFDIAIKAEEDADYKIVSTIDSRTTADGKDITVVSASQDGNMIGTNYWWYTAVIDGLKPNTRYYLKIRTVSADGIAESKYTGVISWRTEFDKDDYDTDQDKDDADLNFLDSLGIYKDRLFWVYDDSKSSSHLNYRIKLRGSKVLNHIRNTEGNTFNIDFASVQMAEADKKSTANVYIPIKVIEVLNETHKTLVLHTMSGDMIFRPGVLDTSKTSAIEEMMDRKENKSSVKDVYVSITIKNLKNSSSYRPSSNRRLISDITSLSAEAQAVNITDDDFEKDIYEELYGDDGTGSKNGLVYEYRQELADFVDDGEDEDEVEEKIRELLVEMDEDLQEYIEDKIESSSFERYSSDIEEVPLPLSVHLRYKVALSENDNTISGYKTEGKQKRWTKIHSENRLSQMITMFEMREIDGYELAVLKGSATLYDIGHHQYRQELQQMNNKYNLAEVLYGNGTLQPDANIKTREAILILERVLQEYPEEYNDTDLVKKGRQLGLDKGLNLNRTNDEMVREEAGFLAMRLYEIKTQASVEHMAVSRAIMLTDDRAISKNLFKAILMSIDMEIMKAENNIFDPKGTVTRAEFIVILKRVLDKLGAW